jgi:hypothetical protein
MKSPEHLGQTFEQLKSFLLQQRDVLLEEGGEAIDTRESVARYVREKLSPKEELIYQGSEASE